MIPNAIRVFEQQRKVISARAGVTAQQLWRRVDPTQVDASMQVIRPHLVRALQGYRRQAAIAAAAYTPALLRETRLETEPVGELSLDRFLEYAPDGRTVDGLYEQAAISAKTRMSRGLMPQLALQQVSALVLTMTLTTLSDTVRSVVAADMTRRPQVTGYVRQLVPPSCSRCVILAGRWYRWNEGFQRHPGCDCIHIPAREDHAGDLTTDPYVYFNSLTKEQQDRLFGKADAQAIRDGADIYRVVNIRERGLATAKGARKFGTPHRLTIDDIYEQAKFRDDAIRLMRQEGFITGPQVRGGNILGRFYEGYGELGKGGRAAAAREAVLEARRTGVRDPLNRYTMTSAERRYYDANYRLKYYERTGKIPATIGPNSADLGVKLRAPSPGEVDALYRQVDQLKNLALQATAPPGLTRLVLALDDLSLEDLRRLEVVALAKGGKHAQAAAGSGRRPYDPNASRLAGNSGGGKPPNRKRPMRGGDDEEEWAKRQAALKSSTNGEMLEPHEIRFLEWFEARGERVSWIPRRQRNQDGGLLPTNDFSWLTNGSLVCELKVSVQKYKTISSHIRGSVARARAQGVRKENFVIYLENQWLRSVLRSQLTAYNIRNPDNRIKRLWVAHGGGMEEIQLEN